MTTTMSVKDLKQLCGALNLTGYSRLRRDELLQLCDSATKQKTEAVKTYTITYIEDGRLSVSYATTTQDAANAAYEFVSHAQGHREILTKARTVVFSDFSHNASLNIRAENAATWTTLVQAVEERTPSTYDWLEDRNIVK